MASIGEALVSKVLGHSAAEKAFRPWWDNLEDYLVYSLVMLGKPIFFPLNTILSLTISGLVVLPTALFNGTPLDCTLCSPEVEACKDKMNSSVSYDPKPDYNAWWVKKYCTFTAIDEFVLYFPYVLLFIAIAIVLIEKGFVTAFRAGLKLNAFYNLLVGESLLEGAITSSTDGKSNKITSAKFLDVENTKLVFEVAQSFHQSSSYFFSYLTR